MIRRLRIECDGSLRTGVAARTLSVNHNALYVRAPGLRGSRIVVRVVGNDGVATGMPQHNALAMRDDL